MKSYVVISIIIWESVIVAGTPSLAHSSLSVDTLASFGFSPFPQQTKYRQVFPLLLLNLSRPRVEPLEHLVVPNSGAVGCVVNSGGNNP